MERRKKIVFVAPDYYGFNEPIRDGLINYGNADVFEIISNDVIPYVSLGERIRNFFSKKIRGVNLKHRKDGKRFLKHLAKHGFGDFDYLIANRPDLMGEDVMKTIQGLSKKTIAIFWDSMEKIPIQQPLIPYFYKCYSFDEDDCNTYGFIKNTNFYFAKDNNQSPIYDIVFLGTLDIRFDKLVKFLNYCLQKNISAMAYIYVPPHLKCPDVLHSCIEYMNSQIPFKESDQIAQDGKIILDLCHSNQRGLSFRPFEAMSLKRKLITDNKNIVNYDFYNSNNIFVLEDLENIEIDIKFFTTDFEALPSDIMEKYSQKNWIQNILR